MDLQKLFNLISENPGMSTAILVAAMSLIQVSPLKINPWSFIGKIFSKSISWVGSRFNQSINEKIDDIEEEIKHVAEKVDEVDMKNDQNRMKELRWTILSFANTLGDNEKTRTVEEFDDIYAAYDEYEQLLTKHSMKNGRTNRAMKKVDRYYDSSDRPEGYIGQRWHEL